MGGLSILLVENSPLFRSALSAVLSRVHASVAACEVGRHITSPHTKYDVVIVDVATFAGTNEELALLIQTYTKLGPVLMLAREDRLDQVITGLRSGAIGLLKQTASERDLRSAIHAVMKGFAWCDREIFRRVTESLVPLRARKVPALTRREEEVLRCIALGKTNKEIASSLALSEQSIKVYVSRLLQKMDSPNRAALALHAATRGVR